MSDLRPIFPPEALDRICREWQVRRLALFGSVLRADFTDKSDIDVLVEFEPGCTPSLIGLSRLKRELEAMVEGRTVDLLTPGSLSRHIRDRVLAESETQFAA